MRYQHALSVVLIAAVAALLVFVSDRYKWEADWTHGNRNSLTDASRRVLDAMPDAIEFTAYAYPGPEREVIRGQVERYRRYRAGIGLTFVDPAKNPREMRELGIRRSGEVRLRYQGRSRTLDDLTEQAVTNALQQLSVAGEQWVVFLAGHDERGLEDDGQGGFSRLSGKLTDQGLKTRVLNLGETPRIPDNASVLVIASPQKSLLPGEVDLIRDYVAGGGNLLWVDDPGQRFGLAPLAADLGLRWRGGTVIYPDYRELGLTHPAIALVVGYPRHPVTERLNALTLFPFAGGLETTSDENGSDANDWHTSTLLRSPSRSWLETGSLESGEIVFDEEDGDAVGPIVMGMALTRELAAGARAPDAETAPAQQRVAVIADSDFLVNGYVDSVGNMDFGLALFQWLSRRDRQIAVNVPPAPDSSLRLAPWQGRTIWYLYVILLPALLLAVGVGRWWWRKRR